MNINTTIDGKAYYTIMQAHKVYAIHLDGNAAYNTFYKKFVWWIKENKIEPVKVKRLKYYSESEIENFISDYSFITNYQPKPTTSL